MTFWPGLEGRPPATKERLPSALTRKLAAVIRLTEAETDGLEALQKRVRLIPPCREFVRDGEPYEQAYVVKSGWAIRYKTLSDGRRQILDFALPGDFVALFAALSQNADHSVAALTALEVYPVEPAALVSMFGECPRLGAAVAWAAGRDEGILCEQVVRVGRRSAYERIGHLIVELLHRLRLVGQASPDSFVLPLTQEILADTLGLSIVHVNRTLRRLRENGLLHIRGDRVVITDLRELMRVAEFSPDYLAAGPLPRQTEAALLSA